MAGIYVPILLIYLLGSKLIGAYTNNVYMIVQCPNFISSIPSAYILFRNILIPFKNRMQSHSMLLHLSVVYI